MRHTRNAAFAARMVELGLSEKELAGLINDAIEAETGERGRTTDRYVRMLLNGTIRWPWEVSRLALEKVLGRSALELGFVPRGRASTLTPRKPRKTARRTITKAAPPDAEASQPPAGQDTTGHQTTDHDPTAPPDTTAPRDDTSAPEAGAPEAQEATVERREMLGIAAGASISIVIPGLPEQGRIGFTDVERLRAPLVDLVAIDQRLGGVAMAPVCVRQAERVLDAIRRFDTSHRVERALYGLVGEYLAAAGWACVDADRLDEARRHMDRALRAANTAQDPMLQAKITNTMFMWAREAGEYAYAHSVARGGLHLNAARTNPRVTALFHARIAEGYSFRGELGQAHGSLGRAQEAMDRITPDTPTPAWLRFFNQAELAALSALTYQTLGRYQLAAEQGELSTERVLPGYVRNSALYTISLARSYLGEREVEQAAVQANAGLDLARQLRKGLHQGRVSRRLQDLRVRFSQWRDVPEACAWVEAYDAAVADHAVSR